MNAMVPLKRLVSAAIVISSATYCRAEAPSVVAGTDDCLLGLNLARSARLSDRLPVLTKVQELETAAIAAINTGKLVGESKENCSVAEGTTPVSASVAGVLLTFDGGAGNPKINCAALLQAQIQGGLTGIGDAQIIAWNNGTADPYKGTPQQNLAYMMFATATGVGCGYTNNCASGKNVVVCKFKPTISDTFKDPPFTAEFYAALKSRQEAGVDISKLGKDDVNTDPTGASGGGGGGGGGGSSNALNVVPAAGILVVSLLGLLSRP